MRRLNEAEAKVLNVLAHIYGHDENCYGFAPIAKHTKLDRPTVRRACRFLARRGLAAYERALWSHDGEPAGAGYCATEAGHNLALSAPTPGKRR